MSESKAVAAAANNNKAEAPKTMKVIFVEDVATYICDQVPGKNNDTCWTSEIIQMCLLKAANLQGTNIVFKYKATPQDEHEEIIPIYQVRVVEANLKANKNDTHTYNVFAVESGKNKNSKFVEEAKKRIVPPAEGQQVDKKEAQLVFATLDMTIGQYHQAERIDSLPNTMVTPGDTRLNREKFEFTRASFYNKMNLPQNYKKQRLIELAEYKLTLELLSKLVMTGKRLTTEELAQQQILVGDKNEKVTVTENFAERADFEIGVVAQNVHPRNKTSYDQKFKKMWKMVADFDAIKFVKEIPVPGAPAAVAAKK